MAWITLLALAGVLALVAMIPTRRLYQSGWPSGSLAVYFLIVWIFSVLVAWGPGRSRYVIPILVVAYLVPFVSWRARIDRLLGRQERPPPPKNVTPPDLR